MTVITSFVKTSSVIHFKIHSQILLVTVGIHSLASWFLYLQNHFFQTFLEQTKTKFNKGYKGMNLAKVTTTVGLNSKIVMHSVCLDQIYETALSYYFSAKILKYFLSY